MSETQPTTAPTTAIIGAGVIGSGWAARFAMSGINVAVYDPGPGIGGNLDEILSDARHAFEALYGSARAEEGQVTIAGSLAEAVSGADYIQESGPERLDLKQSLLADISRLAGPEAVIASSTSGLLPSDLQAKMIAPERFVVAHPFNPVYLLPLVELVGGQKTDPRTLKRVEEMLAGIGMKPLIVRKEIEAFIADRLLEALWREALWLVHDKVATVEEIDDAIRYGCGLRWAQMGTFQTYLMAGGDAGMRHFLAQFGPALKWPWSKLTDTPEMDEHLIETIANQAEEQSAGRSTRDLRKIRDDNLVAILQALGQTNDGRGWGAGEVVRSYESALKSRAQS